MALSQLTSQIFGGEPEAVFSDEEMDRALGASLPDPIERLLDPKFTDVLWEYEGSEIGPKIPGQLHAKQVEALESTARNRFLYWGNQVGKTTWGAVNFILWALGRHPTMQLWQPPLVLWASALTWELWQDIILPELLTWAPKSRIVRAPQPYQQSPNRQILLRADNGTVSRIIGKSADQGRRLYQSARVHAFWADEEHPLAVWQEVQPRIARFGGVTITTMTPLLGLTWVHDDIYEPWKRGKRPDTFCSHAGLQDNPSIDPAEIDRLRREYAGDPAQLAARLEGRFMRPFGLALHLDPQKVFGEWTEEAVQHALRVQKWTQFCGIDFGHWRFAFIHLAADRANRAHALGEYFSQREDLETRAKWIHEYLDRHGAPGETRIWGDAANPTDIVEINKEFRRLKSPYRVRAVMAENKLRAPSVTRINNLMGRGAIRIRRDIGQYMRWRLRMSAASDGRALVGSRLLWEINNWRFPAPKEPSEEAQKQDPDDDTADGADAIAALRYAIMSYYRPPKRPKRKQKKNRNVDTGLEELTERMRRSQQGRER